MKRTLATVALAVVGLMAVGPAIAQQERQSQRASHGQQQVQPDARPRAQVARPMYQRGDTWYEFLLKQFNPNNFDYGAWMEERHQVFLDESVRNPYFKYSLGTTIALLIMAMLYTKQWIDHRRAMWITAEMMTDLYNHDAYSRGVAREAIQKYNDHIERCNRAIEAADHGMSIPGAGSDANNLKGVLDSVTDERDSYKRERDLAKRDLLEKEKLIADMSVRLDAMAKKTDPNRAAAVSIDMSAADPKVVQLINNLQEQLYAERRENRRLKGA
ncbi:MAG: hypothetical protein ABSC64_00350 [Candidatus Korobacteraceae bacterium]